MPMPAMFGSGRCGVGPLHDVRKEPTMSVAKVIEISARSDESFEAAIAHGISEASKTVHGIQEAWVKEMKVTVANNAVTSYQVGMKLTFVVD